MTTSSGEPERIGLYISPGALDGLATPAMVAESDRGVEHHGHWSKPFTLGLPDTVPPPFEYVGFAWNPEGHPQRDVWDMPHFDIHFHFEEPNTVSDIDGGTVDELPEEVVPEGYRLADGGSIVPQMGAHLVPSDAPEFSDGAFTNTLMWGAAAVGDDNAYELHFVEPMVTTDYLRSLDEVDRRPIAHPEVYPTAGWYPTAYAVQPLDDGGYVITLEAFDKRPA